MWVSSWGSEALKIVTRVDFEEITLKNQIGCLIVTLSEGGVNNQRTHIDSYHICTHRGDTQRTSRQGRAALKRCTSTFEVLLRPILKTRL